MGSEMCIRDRNTIVDLEQSFEDHIENNKNILRSVLKHSAIAFDELVKVSKLDPDGTYQSLAQVALIEFCAPTLNVEREGLKAGFDLYNGGTSFFDVAFVFFRSGDGIEIQIEYDREKISKLKAGEMLMNFETLINYFVVMPEGKISNALPLLKSSFVIHGKNTRIQENSSLQKCIKDSFRDHGARILIRGNDFSLTYSEIDKKSKLLAGFLVSQGARRGRNIVVYMERSVHSFVTMLAVFRIGCVFVPLNSGLQPRKLREILLNNEHGLLLTSGDSSIETAEIIDKYKIDINHIDLDYVNLHVDLDSWAGNAESARFNIDEPAYLIYTSGTTGEPKGVLQRGRTLVNLIAWQSEKIKTESTERVMPVSYTHLTLPTNREV